VSKIYDVAVIGAGAMGSAAIYQLSKMHKKVIVFDQFSPPHHFGSSGGDSRICRLAIGEGRFYTPYALTSYEICRGIERQTSFELLQITGGIMMASASDKSLIHGRSDFIGETEKAALDYHIEHEICSTDQIHDQWPEFNLVGDEVGYYEPGAGFMIPENCIKAQLQLAKRNGATLNFRDKVLDIKPSASGECVYIEASSGKYVARKVILSVGSWISRFISNHASLFEVKRQVQYWFDIKKEKFPRYRLGNNFPIFIWQRDCRFLYGFPAINGSAGGLKVASERVDLVDPDLVDRKVSKEEIERMYELNIRNYMPDLLPSCVKTSVCMYTSTPDRHFVVDWHPDFPNQVMIVSPDSGHGFKHSMAIGKTVAEMAVTGKPTLDISHFRLNRFKI